MFSVYNLDIFNLLPKVGDEDIHLEPEENIDYDDFAVAVLFEGRRLGHVPRNLSQIMALFLRLPGSSILYKVTGKRVNRGAGYGLEIPVSYKFVGAEKAVDWAEEKIKKRFEIVDKKVKNVQNKNSKNYSCLCVRFVERFFKGNAHLVHEKGVRFSTVRFITVHFIESFL